MRIAITGCGWVTPLVAGDIGTVLSAYASRGGKLRNPPRYEPVRPEVLAPFPNLPAEAAKEPAVRLAAMALELAWKQAGLGKESYPSDRKGLVLGSALAGVSGMIDFANDVREQSTRFVSPIRFPQTVGNFIGGALARCYDFRGPASTIACGCASSLEAIREGCTLLTSDQAGMVVAGGSELLNPQIVEDLNESEVHFADGACLFVLEKEASARARSADVLATVDLQCQGVAFQSPASEVIETVAGLLLPNTVTIERWTGRTLGADGAAAMAVGIGAATGRSVPWSDGASGTARGPSLDDKSDRQLLLVRAGGGNGNIHEISVTVGLG